MRSPSAPRLSRLYLQAILALLVIGLISACSPSVPPSPGLTSSPGAKQGPSSSPTASPEPTPSPTPTLFSGCGSPPSFPCAPTDFIFVHGPLAGEGAFLFDDGNMLAIRAAPGGFSGTSQAQLDSATTGPLFALSGRAQAEVPGQVGKDALAAGGIKSCQSLSGCLASAPVGGRSFIYRRGVQMATVNPFTACPATKSSPHCASLTAYGQEFYSAWDKATAANLGPDWTIGPQTPPSWLDPLADSACAGSAAKKCVSWDTYPQVDSGPLSTPSAPPATPAASPSAAVSASPSAGSSGSPTAAP